MGPARSVTRPTTAPASSSTSVPGLSGVALVRVVVSMSPYMGSPPAGAGPSATSRVITPSEMSGPVVVGEASTTTVEAQRRAGLRLPAAGVSPSTGIFRMARSALIDLATTVTSGEVMRRLSGSTTVICSAASTASAVVMSSPSLRKTTAVAFTDPFGPLASRWATESRAWSATDSRSAPGVPSPRSRTSWRSRRAARGRKSRAEHDPEGEPRTEQRTATVATTRVRPSDGWVRSTRMICCPGDPGTPSSSEGWRQRRSSGGNGRPRGTSSASSSGAMPVEDSDDLVWRWRAGAPGPDGRQGVLLAPLLRRGRVWHYCPAGGTRRAPRTRRLARRDRRGASPRPGLGVGGAPVVRRGGVLRRDLAGPLGPGRRGRGPHRGHGAGVRGLRRAGHAPPDRGGRRAAAPLARGRPGGAAAPGR